MRAAVCREFGQSFILRGVDGFDQDECCSDGDRGAEVLFDSLAAQGDALEAFELADGRSMRAQPR